MVVALLTIIAILLAVIAFGTGWIKVSLKVTVALIVFAVVGVFAVYIISNDADVYKTIFQTIFAILLGLFMIFISVAAIWRFVEITSGWYKEFKPFINKIKSKFKTDK